MVESRIWNLPLEALLKELRATPGGLAQEVASQRLAEFGPNDALAHRRRPLWRQVLARFANPLILILLFASGLSAWTGEVASCAIIVVIILLSVVIDVAQQWRAESTVDALRRSVGLRARALRDGAEQPIPVEQLVPGDVVRLQAGDIVSADCRLLAARDFFVNQALLTGEPYPVEKHASDLASPVEESRRGPQHGLYGHSRDHRERDRRRVPHGARDRARRACRRARRAAAHKMRSSTAFASSAS